MTSNPTFRLDDSRTDWSNPVFDTAQIARVFAPNPALPARITRAASTQTYMTIRLFVDRNRVMDAYRTYAYFRWVDDWLDEELATQAERLVFVERQQAILERCVWGESPRYLRPEERMLVDLLRSEPDVDSGLHAYARHMMAVMAFDAARRGRLISQQELDTYSRNLAIAVTEALHYFIGHNQFAPRGATRYQAVTGAHIAHLLRDTYEDVEAGYFNVPREFLDAQQIDIHDVDSAAYRLWARLRVQQARACFETGRRHLAQVECGRCRLAGYAYIARFQWVLDAIARDDYRIRSDYSERKSLSGVLQTGATFLSLLLGGQVEGTNS